MMTAMSQGMYAACGSSMAKMGRATAERIDARETYFESAKAAMKTTSAARAAHGASVRKTPKAVATPLPPLKRSHTG